MSQDAVRSPMGAGAGAATATQASNGVAEDGRHGSALLQISNAMVKLYKEAFGRGPTKARAQFAGSDTLIVLLEDTMTVAERNLAAMGEHGRLRDSRLVFQESLEHRFRAAVEQVLGRRTIAFVSGIDPQQDLSVEVFTLEPRSSADHDGRPSER